MVSGDMKRNLSVLILSLLASACSPAANENHYRLTSEYFSPPDYDVGLNLPLNVLENISRIPKTDCEREDLRRLFITADWQMHEFNNQGYMLDAKSIGVATLVSSFPELKDMEIYREGGALVDTTSLRKALLKLDTGCD